MATKKMRMQSVARRALVGVHGKNRSMTEALLESVASGLWKAKANK